MHPVKTNQKTHAVYSIPCGDCEKEYLGQSKRQFGTRLKEHQKAVSTLDKGKSALAVSKAFSMFSNLSQCCHQIRAVLAAVY
jgi:hypothetical protein